MDFRKLLDEVLTRGERLKDEVVTELLRSRTIQEVVANKNFIKAISRVIESKAEVKKAIDKQVKGIFSLMDIPTKTEIGKIANQLIKIENVITKLGEKKLKGAPLRKRRTAGRRRS